MESDHNKAALLVMDMQNIIVSQYAKHEDALFPFQKAVEAALVDITYRDFCEGWLSPGSPSNMQ
ncbi:MAG TPA: hypothetical protein DEF35_10795 [Paenibacillus sp.]|uniref:hypothetical protein n=1 Tax=Paenibacillus TaxID=44249 RepID=UPI000BA0FAF4|nr:MULTISPECIES: hypothetical protein [Paenibacillus]OZQ73303.1 hypothetical protein CA599_03335 [Paenibacillus taichungensis]HBU82111.1 hypothetical protein [Paenibacillus sp.]